MALKDNKSSKDDIQIVTGSLAEQTISNEDEIQNSMEVKGELSAEGKLEEQIEQ